MTLIERTYELVQFWKFLEPPDGNWKDNPYPLRLMSGDTYRVHFVLPPRTIVNCLYLRLHNVYGSKEGSGFFNRYIVDGDSRKALQNVLLGSFGQRVAWPTAKRTGTNIIFLLDDQFHEFENEFTVDFDFFSHEPADVNLYAKTVEAFAYLLPASQKQAETDWLKNEPSRQIL